MTGTRRMPIQKPFVFAFSANSRSATKRMYFMGLLRKSAGAKFIDFGNKYFPKRRIASVERVERNFVLKAKANDLVRVRALLEHDFILLRRGLGVRRQLDDALHAGRGAQRRRVALRFDTNSARDRMFGFGDRAVEHLGASGD